VPGFTEALTTGIRDKNPGPGAPERLPRPENDGAPVEDQHIVRTRDVRSPGRCRSPRIARRSVAQAAGARW
jgi:hypothetical protein